MNKDLKRLRRKRKEEKRKREYPKLKLTFCSNAQPAAKAFRADLLKIVEQTDVTGLFWKDVPMPWRRNVIAQYHKTGDMSPKDVEFFKNMSADTLEDILMEHAKKYSSKYGKLNYSIQVISPRLMRYEVYCEVLETASTSHGTIHFLPKVLFPPNKRIAITNHTIARMDNRLFDEMHKKHGCVLRTNMIIIPYSNDISALYGQFQPMATMLFNGYSQLYYVLMGYVPVAEEDDILVCKTILRPGYDQTPEKGMPDEEIVNSRILTVVDNTIHMAKEQRNRRLDAGATCMITTKPYDLRINPNVKLLLGLKDLK